MIAAARAAKLPIIYVVVGFRPGYPELDPRSLMATVLAKTGRMQMASPGSDIAPELRPHDGDLVAFDADYRLVVVEDCCADGDDEVHRVLMTKVYARHTSEQTSLYTHHRSRPLFGTRTNNVLTGQVRAAPAVRRPRDDSRKNDVRTGRARRVQAVLAGTR